MGGAHSHRAWGGGHSKFELNVERVERSVSTEEASHFWSSAREADTVFIFFLTASRITRSSAMCINFSSIASSQRLFHACSRAASPFSRRTARLSAGGSLQRPRSGELAGREAESDPLLLTVLLALGREVVPVRLAPFRSLWPVAWRALFIWPCGLAYRVQGFTGSQPHCPQRERGRSGTEMLQPSHSECMGGIGRGARKAPEPP